MNANDKKIMVLKRQIEAKKAQLSGGTTFSPVTNCSLEIFGVRYNLHTLNTEQLLYMQMLLNTYFMSAKSLGTEKQVKVAGYILEDWLADISARLMIVNRKEEEAKLKAMEARLHNLLSTDTRVGLEIDEIEKSI